MSQTLTWHSKNIRGRAMTPNPKEERSTLFQEPYKGKEPDEYDMLTQHFGVQPTIIDIDFNYFLCYITPSRFGAIAILFFIYYAPFTKNSWQALKTILLTKNGDGHIIMDTNYPSYMYSTILAHEFVHSAQNRDTSEIDAERDANVRSTQYQVENGTDVVAILNAERNWKKTLPRSQKLKKEVPLMRQIIGIVSFILVFWFIVKIFLIGGV